jgi:hypothetical protein
LVVRRWRLLVIIPPAILLWLALLLSDSEFQPVELWYFAGLSSACTALGIVAGVAIRRFATRNAKLS